MLYHHAENGYFSHKARIRYPQWLARLPGQYSPEGTGSAIHYDLNTMAMKRFKNIPYVILFLNDQPVRVGCNTSQLTGLGKRKIIADRQLWVGCCLFDIVVTQVSNYLGIPSGRLHSLQSLVEIRNNIFSFINANRKPDQLVGDTRFESRLSRNSGMRHGSRRRNQGIHSTKTDGQAVHEFTSRFDSACNALSNQKKSKFDRVVIYYHDNLFLNRETNK